MSVFKVALKLNIFVSVCAFAHGFACLYVRVGVGNKQHGLLLPLICGGDLLFRSRELERLHVCSGGERDEGARRDANPNHRSALE